MKKKILILLFIFSGAFAYAQSSKMPENVLSTNVAPPEIKKTRQTIQNEKAVFDSYSPAQKQVLSAWNYPVYINTGVEDTDIDLFSEKVRAWRLANAGNMQTIKNQLQTN